MKNRRYRTEFFRNCAWLALIVSLAVASHLHANRVAQYESEREAIAHGHAVETGGETRVAFRF